MLLIALLQKQQLNKDGTECCETSAYKIQTPWNKQKVRTQILSTGVLISP